jgi:hypothetical protein
VNLHRTSPLRSKTGETGGVNKPLLIQILKIKPQHVKMKQ